MLSLATISSCIQTSLAGGGDGEMGEMGEMGAIGRRDLFHSFHTGVQDKAN